jgi:hypothetical protein
MPLEELRSFLKDRRTRTKVLAWAKPSGPQPSRQVRVMSPPNGISCMLAQLTWSLLWPAWLLGRIWCAHSSCWSWTFGDALSEPVRAGAARRTPFHLLINENGSLIGLASWGHIQSQSTIRSVRSPSLAVFLRLGSSSRCQNPQCVWRS